MYFNTHRAKILRQANETNDLGEPTRKFSVIIKKEVSVSLQNSSFNYTIDNISGRNVSVHKIYMNLLSDKHGVKIPILIGDIFLINKIDYHVTDIRQIENNHLEITANSGSYGRAS